MATVTKPIALDESLNTTELSSRNVADVLAQELSAVATAISGISAPSAEDVSYDNSGSGLSATDVQNALDEIVSGIPTVNDGTLTIQQNGETKGTFTANQSGNSTVIIKIPTTDIQTAVDEFSTYNGGLLSECIIELVPVQSGSGDPSPDNVRPISGHTEVDLYNVGKNLIKVSNDSLVSEQNDVSTILDSGVEVTATTYYSRRIDAFDIELGEDYVISFNGKSTGGFNKFYIGYDENDVNNMYTTKTLDSTETYYTYSFTAITKKLVLVCYVTTITQSGTMSITDLQLEKGNQATTYEPYLGHLYQVQIGSTVYGGSVDLVSGVMNCIYGYADVLSSDIIGEYLDTTNNQYLAKITPSNVKVPSSTSAIPNMISNCLKVVSQNYLYDNVGNYVCILNNGAIRFTFENCTTLSDMQTWITNHPLQICYELATPTPIQLSPTMVKALVGENHLDAPLEGQEITESKYKQTFTFDDVITYIQSLS